MKRRGCSVRPGAGDVDQHDGNIADAPAPGIGALLIALMLARHFDKFHGGNTP